MLLTDAMEFCSVNFTSSDPVLLAADIVNVTIDCHVSYFTASQWIPYIQCLPNIPGQTEVITDASGNVTYSKSSRVAPDLHGRVIRCFAKFNDTKDKPQKGQAGNVPRDVLLWNSRPLQVQCMQLLHVITSPPPPRRGVKYCDKCVCLSVC